MTSGGSWLRRRAETSDYDGAKPFKSEQAVVVKTKPDIKVREAGMLSILK